MIEAETEDRLKQRIIRCLRGLKGWSTPEEYAAITVTRVIGTADVTASYVPGAAE
ncbi:hypothetical protein [Streptomyces sp. NPDC004435]|uniref:hypothetical protein n=1 Tax=Streptomyces sp. NPDC004435 TaxID=3364701 RepID=UPI003677A989